MIDFIKDTLSIKIQDAIVFGLCMFFFWGMSEEPWTNGEMLKTMVSVLVGILLFRAGHLCYCRANEKSVLQTILGKAISVGQIKESFFEAHGRKISYMALAEIVGNLQYKGLITSHREIDDVHNEFSLEIEVFRITNDGKKLLEESK